MQVELCVRGQVHTLMVVMCSYVKNKLTPNIHLFSPLQVSSEISTLKTTCHKLEAQLRQAQAAVQVKEGEVVSAVSARDKALRDSQTLRGQLDKLQEQHRDKVRGLVKWLPNLGPGELHGVCRLLLQTSTNPPDFALFVL